MGCHFGKMTGMSAKDNACEITTLTQNTVFPENMSHVNDHHLTYDNKSAFLQDSVTTVAALEHNVGSYLPSRISMVMERDTTSRDARSLALGA